MTIRDLARTVADCTEQYVAGGPSIEHRQENGLNVIEVYAFPDSLNVPAGRPLVDVVFFQVAFTETAADLTAADLLSLVGDAEHGEFADMPIDTLRREPQSYIALGGWLGDQGLALCFMALCQHKGVGKVISLRDLVGSAASDAEVRRAAGAGMLYLRLNSEEDAETREPALTAAR